MGLTTEQIQKITSLRRSCGWKTFVVTFLHILWLFAGNLIMVILDMRYVHNNLFLCIGSGISAFLVARSYFPTVTEIAKYEKEQFTKILKEEE